MCIRDRHQTSGTNEADNTQIVSEMYEIFAKENARAASQANYQEGKALNEKYLSLIHISSRNPEDMMIMRNGIYLMLRKVSV